METYLWVIIVVVVLLLGSGITYLARQLVLGQKLREVEKQIQDRLEEANTKYKEMLLEAKEEGIKIKGAAEAEYRERRVELQRQERRLTQKEENLERKLEAAERREHNMANKEKQLEATYAQIEEIKKRQLKQLETISGLTSSDAKQLLLQELEAEFKDEASRKLREWEVQVREEAVARARNILAAVIQRCATDVVSETTSSVVPLPSDEMKGRLIGREGRNIRALEQATGVDLIIDDTPEAVTLSSFDPVRRQIAYQALQKLMLDGRIHPARIEEVVEKVKGEVEATMRAEGEQAVYKAGLHGLHPELIKLLGRLKYRTSYGQNVLMHSLEVAHLSGLIAAEVGADVELAKKAGLLHDIGKAVDHEVEGPHATIGADLVKQWEKSPQVVKAIAEHHGEVESTSVESFIVAAADAISGSRPGARGESLDQYLKRLEALENIANSFKGVEKSFAIQAGREIRILVKPEEIDDVGAMRLARDIVKKVQENLEYPGQIKITVIRETRAVDYAK